MPPLSRRVAIASTLASGAGLISTAQAADAQDALPQPRVGQVGADILGPRNPALERENPNLLAPPRTDHGSVPNLKWSFADSHMRLEDGGWTRETTVRELPISTTMAGVNMRLEAGAIRELHWHKAAEWALMLAGQARVTLVDELGRNFVDDIAEGDLWFFPAGLPHSIQGLGDHGCEFLLVFDDGSFSEDNTFLLSDWFRHTPPAVLAKNFPGSAPGDFGQVPKELYIFRAPVPPALAADRMADPEGTVPRPFTYRMMAQTPQRLPGGSVRVVDQRTFPVTTMAAAYVEVEPGAMRELHWHPNVDEWQYWISGQGRMTVFASSGDARTFDFQAGDVGYVPFAMGHYIENTGGAPLRYLEMFRSPVYQDVSLSQWLGTLPPELVQAHLKLPQAVMDQLPKTKPLIVGS